MPFSISQCFNPRFNALRQIGSDEYTLVCQYDDKLVQHAHVAKKWYLRAFQP